MKSIFNIFLDTKKRTKNMVKGNISEKKQK